MINGRASYTHGGPAVVRRIGGEHIDMQLAVAATPTFPASWQCMMHCIPPFSQALHSADSASDAFPYLEEKDFRSAFSSHDVRGHCGVK